VVTESGTGTRKARPHRGTARGAAGLALFLRDVSLVPANAEVLAELPTG
jgi:hypothetical protein